MAVNGATEQSYYEPGGLNGAYQVLMTGTDGVLYRSCVYEIKPEEPSGTAAETEQAEAYYTVDGRRCAAPKAPGIYIFYTGSPQATCGGMSTTHKLIVR